MVVTETLMPGHTFEMSRGPERVGHWISIATFSSACAGRPRILSVGRESAGGCDWSTACYRARRAHSDHG